MTAPMQPRFPSVHVKLTGTDGNAFAVIAAVNTALKHAGIDKAERSEFFNEATAGDYNNLLRVAMAWVDVR